MNLIVSAKEMMHADRQTIEHFKVPSVVLMERAAVSVCDYIQGNYPYAGHIGICCGTGNNGGDGLAAARILHTRGIRVTVVLIGSRSKLSEDCKRQYDTLLAYGISVHEDVGVLSDCDIFVDALFGTGLSREITGTYADVIRTVNASFSMPKLAVDIASGIDATGGQVLGEAIRCDETITFAYIKRGALLYPGRSYTGKLTVAEIGISVHSFMEKLPHVLALTSGDIAAMLPARDPAGHKGTFGRVLCICGSKDMAGAAVLSAKAALRAGCGMVKVLTPEVNRTIIQSVLPEALLGTYEGRIKEDWIAETLSWADVILIGPGLSVSKDAHTLLHAVLKNASVPVVADADALNIIAEDVDVLRRPHTDMAITPHVAEMARLRSLSVSYIKEHMIETAEEFAREYAVECVLKDATTVCAIPFAETYLNMTGNSGMATAGSGDVLAGMLAGLCAQGLDLKTAAPLAVYLHGQAGDAAARKHSKYAMTASDMIDAIDEIMMTHTGC